MRSNCSRHYHWISDRARDRVGIRIDIRKDCSARKMSILLPQPRRKSYAWVYVVIVGAALSVGLFFVGRYTAGSKNNGVAFADPSASKSIAVLPFVNLSADKNG